jgi:dsRNA-specific ribonuclease
MKKFYQQQNDEPLIIYKGSRGDDFKSTISSVFTKGHLKPQYTQWLLSEDSLKIFNDVFTSNTANVLENYEVYEQLGDITVNKFIVWYMYKRFPQLNCAQGVKIVARLRINYCSKQSFAQIAESLGFWTYITASEEERNHNKKPLLEDTLEAFFGAIEFIIDKHTLTGVGYAVVFDILETIFDNLHISLKYEDLYDAKTRLKELFDFCGDRLGTIKYEDDRNIDDKITTSCIYQITPQNNRVKIGEGSASLKADAQQRAAQKAIYFLKQQGFSKPVPEVYAIFNNA